MLTMAKINTDKEDVIEDQNDKEIDKEDVIEDQNDKEIDKEDVIEDQNDTIKGDDNAILKRLDSFANELESMRGDIKKLSDMSSAFVESGAVIRDENIDTNFTEKETETFVPIEELDLNL